MFWNTTKIQTVYEWIFFYVKTTPYLRENNPAPPPEALTKLKLRVEFARYFLFSPSCSTCAQALGAKRLNNVESNLRNGPCARQSIQW